MILENNFVRLEVLNESHLEFLHEFIHQQEIWKYSLIPMKTKEDIKKYVEMAIQYYHEGSQLPFIVFDKLTNRYVGSTRLYEISTSNKRAKLGYTWYDKVVQGTKVNKSCKYLLLDYAFNQLDFNRIEFNADVRNEKSIFAMKSLGAEAEGVLRKHTILPDGYCRDTIVLSILKDDWNKDLSEKLRQKLV